MASLATNYREHFAGAAQPRAGGPARNQADLYRLRPLPNEDVYFFVKRIDNSRVLRQADPGARGACWGLIGASILVALLLSALLLPGAYGLLAGYQIDSLDKEREKLERDWATLKLEEAELLSASRMEALAQSMELLDPPPGRVVYLNPKPDGSVAMNVGTTR